MLRLDDIVDPLYINGRFLTQSLSGVQRYAVEVVGALEALVESGAYGNLQPVLMTPRGARLELGSKIVQQREVGRLQGHAWEQVDLLAHTRHGVLLSLTGTGPVRHPRHFVTLHDAGVYANPGNFSFAFRTWYRALFGMLARSAAGFFTVSEFSRGELARYCGIEAERIAVTYNGVGHITREPSDTSWLEREGLSSGAYVLCVGADSPNKNVGLVVEALRVLGDPSLTLVLVGTRNPRVFKRRDGADASTVHYVGHVSDGALRALYENALCLAFPSLYEGFGIPPMEAMACGCPAIVARTSALPESCGSAALYCDPGDARELAEHIARLRDSEALREELRVAGYAHVERFTWRESARRILDVVAAAAATPA